MTGLLQHETLRAIEAKLGRPLRVLHIGNIANNAYNNARVQRQCGIEADVLCYDYYHVMATPEWEDAQFEGQIDPDAPNWWGTSLGGWKRPDWFVQGPASACLQYLRAKHFGYRNLQNLLWGYLEARCLSQVRDTAKLKGGAVQPVPKHLSVAEKVAEATGAASGPAHRVSYEAISEILALRTTELGPLFPVDELDPQFPLDVLNPGGGLLFPPKPAPLAANMLRHMHAIFVRLAVRPANIAYRIAFDHLVRDELNDPNGPGRLAGLWLAQRRWRRGAEDIQVLQAQVQELERGSQLLRAAFAGMRYRIKKAGHRTVQVSWSILASGIRSGLRQQLRMLLKYQSTISTAERDKKFISVFKENATHIEKYSPKDRILFLLHYATFGAQFIDIFKMYDIVQAYSIDGCLCVVNGCDRFISYEHGTLRDLPFGHDFYGVVTPIAYRASTFVFVTNSDVLPSATRMKLDPARIVCLPHAFDDRKLLRFRAENPDLQPPAGPPVIFSPARQHWKGAVASWLKGNDVLLRACGLVAAEGLDFRLRLVEWGEQVEQSKALIAELGIADKVVWVPTMKKRELWQAYCEAHVVVDQFTMPALGGVGFEAMTLGRRLITAIDEPQLKHFFGEAPPCLAASTVEECAAQLRRVIADPQDKAGIGAASQTWMRTYHSAKRIMDIQVETYKRFLEGDDVAARVDGRRQMTASA